MRSVFIAVSFCGFLALAACSDDNTSGEPGPAGTGGASGAGGTATGGTSGTGGTTTGGSAGAAGSGLEICPGSDECENCLQATCASELAACIALPGCIRCAQRDDTACSDAVQDEATDLLVCSYDCQGQCDPRPDGIAVDCEAPAVSPSSGGCMSIVGDFTCNPVSNEGCDTTSGEACVFGWDPEGTVCKPGPNSYELCATCTDVENNDCAPGLECVFPGTAGANRQCARRCCDDSDCGPNGTCLTCLDAPLGKLGALPSDMGFCVEK